MTYDSLIRLSPPSADLLIWKRSEIKETARAVVRASLTESPALLFHAKSVRGVYERLLELGVSEEEKLKIVYKVLLQRD